MKPDLKTTPSSDATTVSSLAGVKASTDKTDAAPSPAVSTSPDDVASSPLLIDPSAPHHTGDAKPADDAATNLIEKPQVEADADATGGATSVPVQPTDQLPGNAGATSKSGDSVTALTKEAEGASAVSTGSDALTRELAIETNSKPGTTPLINLLAGSEAPAGATPVAVATVPTVPSAAPLEGLGKSRHWALPIVVVGLLTVVAGAATVNGVTSGRTPASLKVAVTTPSPSLTPSITPSPLVTPSPTAQPTLSPVIAPETVTAPAVAPTQDHPQSVTVQAKNGVWLRSSPSSVNQQNVISWIPRGGVVSVDAVGEFWWHGTFNGKTGYFASKFTR